MIKPFARGVNGPSCPLTRIIGSYPTFLKPLQQRGTNVPLSDPNSQFIRAYVEGSRHCFSEAFITGLDVAVVGQKASDGLAPKACGPERI
jgi:hypothetical protein